MIAIFELLFSNKMVTWEHITAFRNCVDRNITEKKTQVRSDINRVYDIIRRNRLTSKEEQLHDLFDECSRLEMSISDLVLDEEYYMPFNYRGIAFNIYCKFQNEDSFKNFIKNRIDRLNIVDNKIRLFKIVPLQDVSDILTDGLRKDAPKTGITKYEKHMWIRDKGKLFFSPSYLLTQEYIEIFKKERRPSAMIMCEIPLDVFNEFDVFVKFNELYIKNNIPVEYVKVIKPCIDGDIIIHDYIDAMETPIIIKVKEGF